MMITNDSILSLDDDEQTVIRPIPGGKRSDIPIARQRKQSISEPIEPVSVADIGQINPLEGTLSRLLALLAQLKHTHSHPSPNTLRSKIIREIRRFQGAAQEAGIDMPTVATARYVMCAALDEAIINTPWGQECNWANQGLLGSFHQEVCGGERFFALLVSLVQYPAKNRSLLELMFICLVLGFEGKYRLREDGKDKLARIREWLYQILEKERGAGERELSPRWRGVTDRHNPLRRDIPLWVIGATGAALLALIFSFYLYWLNGLSDTVFRQLLALEPPAIYTSGPAGPTDTSKTANTKTDAPKTNASTPDVQLSKLLAEEIQQKLIYVDELGSRSKVQISSDSLFRSASASINASVIPLLHRIGESVNQIPGDVVINGYTDSVPIRNARYPSNWHLSQHRADAVANLIRSNLKDRGRVTARGRAGAQPIASNENPEGRAKNRRVDIVLIR